MALGHLSRRWGDVDSACSERVPNGELNRRVGAVLAIESVRFGQCERRLRHEARSRTPMPLGCMNEEGMA